MTQPAYNKNRKMGIPTAGVIEYRSVLYPVSRRISNVRETVHGGVRVEKGKLTARHRDYIDAIMANCEKTAFDQVGQLVIIFDDLKIRKVLGIADSRWDDLRDRLLEIMSTVVSVRKTGAKWPPAFPILTFVGESETMMTNHGNNRFEGRMKKIILSAGMVDLMMTDAHLYVNKGLTNFILALGHQISRSVAKWTLTHTSDQHHSFVNMFDYVGVGNCSDRMKRDYVSQLKSDAPMLKQIGITIEGSVIGGMIHSSRNQSVFISTSTLLDAAEPKTPWF